MWRRPLTPPSPRKNGAREGESGASLTWDDQPDRLPCRLLTSPRSLRGEVGLRSNPGEGQGTPAGQIESPPDASVVFSSASGQPATTIPGGIAVVPRGAICDNL
ncbi:hypothetical protein WN72_37015 [Bradyrhizobium arachidis]|uniref:Uncharacterized protein n=1 Tax=Bradyrhizobium arachidis TaxID=858423 RepID=A0AAE7NSN9_9BRAD|nr:hypothetical protein WN72_37015 [Bradyrhizobium arachidis]